MSKQIFTTDKFQFSENCLSLIFNNLLEFSDEFNSDLDGWKLFEYLLDYVHDLNMILPGGKYKGETYLRAAVKAQNKRMVFLLISNEHGTALRNGGVSIEIDEESKKWIQGNL